jgi:hypothetical protein
MSSVTRSAQGEFTLVFSSSFTDAFYAIYGTIQFAPLASPNQNDNRFGGLLNVGRGTGNRTASQVIVGSQYSVDGINYDPIYVSVVCSRG